MDEDEKLVEMHAIARGNVQGVGFRATTRYLALQLKLKGMVRNLPDGSVEIYAQGSQTQLKTLVERLKLEAFPGSIDDLSIHYSSPMQAYDSFRIVH
jgi:acylphosphatase